MDDIVSNLISGGLGCLLGYGVAMIRVNLKISQRILAETKKHHDEEGS